MKMKLMIGSILLTFLLLSGCAYYGGYGDYDYPYDGYYHSYPYYYGHDYGHSFHHEFSGHDRGDHDHDRDEMHHGR